MGVKRYSPVRRESIEAYQFSVREDLDPILEWCSGHLIIGGPAAITLKDQFGNTLIAYHHDFIVKNSAGYFSVIKSDVFWLLYE